MQDNQLLKKEGVNGRVVALWSLALALYLFYLLGHNPVSTFCYYLRDTYTEAVYRNAILGVGKILLGVYVLWLVWRLRLTAHKWLKISVWLLFAGVLTTYYNDMVKISIEYVHFMQYCGLTIVVAYALRGRSLLACALCLLAGFMDEVYQTLAPVSQLNWRDVGLNVTGCIWGWLLLWTLKTDVVSSR